MTVSRKMRRSRPAQRWRGWVRMRTERLLDVRLCDLDLAIEGTAVEKRIRGVRAELERRDITFQPYFWISDEWFTPAGVTGTAVPFYILHPRLRRLERLKTGEVEGGTEEWCMKILRHEVGHALDHAYLLHRRRRWQQLFGHSSRPYPRHYRPNPYSRRHVQHLEYWYAQSHPDEDFAETFAVWLGPRGVWRRRYKGWPALRKLEYVDDLMAEIAGSPPLLRTRCYVDPICRIRKTLRKHYEANSARGNAGWPDSYDDDLRQLFSPAGSSDAERASAFLRRHQPEVTRLVSRWIGGRRYHLDHVYKELIGRCRNLKLRAAGPERRTVRDFGILLTKCAVDSLYRRRDWIPL